MAARLAGARERMEAPGQEVRALHASLAELAWINRRLGGTRLVLRQVAALAPRLPDPIRVLDVATGHGDIPRALSEWAREHGRTMEIVAVDRHPAIARLAAGACRTYSDVHLAVAEAAALPFEPGRFHVALASLVLHHLEGGEPLVFLRELDRVASHAVIVNDLRRGWLPLVGTWLGLHAVSRDATILYDGPLSVRRAYTAGEALALAHAAGWHNVRLSRHPWFRIALVRQKDVDGGQ